MLVGRSAADAPAEARLPPGTAAECSRRSFGRSTAPTVPSSTLNDVPRWYHPLGVGGTKDEAPESGRRWDDAAAMRVPSDSRSWLRARRLRARDVTIRRPWGDA